MCEIFCGPQKCDMGGGPLKCDMGGGPLKCDMGGGPPICAPVLVYFKGTDLVPLKCVYFCIFFITNNLNLSFKI